MDRKGRTPLAAVATRSFGDAATEAAWASVASTLLDLGADVERGDEHLRETPLMAALLENNMPLLEMLIARGADINAAVRSDAAADAAIIAEGRCPLGDVNEQDAAIAVWAGRSQAEMLAAAAKGDLAACDAIGESFYFGTRGPVDHAQAAAFYARAAEGNVARACFNLATMHEQGEGGLAQSDASAVALYRRAAGDGLVDAMFNLGVCLSEARGSPLDQVEAVRLWRAAADEGDVDSEAALANAFLRGEGVEVDFAAALQHGQRAAEKGDAVAQCLLGEIFDSGLGVPRDAREGVKWFAKAAVQGQAEAAEQLSRLAATGDADAAAALAALPADAL
jgi:TPR repeat protein